MFKTEDVGKSELNIQFFKSTVYFTKSFAGQTFFLSIHACFWTENMRSARLGPKNGKKVAFKLMNVQVNKQSFYRLKLKLNLFPFEVAIIFIITDVISE